MTSADLDAAYANLLKLHALAWNLDHAAATAKATGQPLPPAYAGLVAQGQAWTRTLRLEVNADEAKRRFQQRYSR